VSRTCSSQARSTPSDLVSTPPPTSPAPAALEPTTPAASTTSTTPVSTAPTPASAPPIPPPCFRERDETEVRPLAVDPCLLNLQRATVAWVRRFRHVPVTEPPKSLGPTTAVLIPWTSDNPAGAPDHLTSSVSEFLIFPKSVSPVMQTLQYIGDTKVRKQLQ
jgi:hypothetical protein